MAESGGGELKGVNHKEHSAAKPQPKLTTDGTDGTDMKNLCNPVIRGQNSSQLANNFDYCGAEIRRGFILSAFLRVPLRLCVHLHFKAFQF